MAEAVRDNPGFRDVLNPPPVLEKAAAASVGQQIQHPKLRLCNMIATFLLKEPRFTTDSEATTTVRNLATEVATDDPEFLLKLALYVRTVLYIRSTANFLLALAATLPGCQPFLRSYFCGATNLPSDVMDVVDQYRMLTDRVGLPHCLKRAVQDKFLEFTEYQLGKYCSDGAAKRKAKKAKAAAAAKAEKAGEKDKKKPAKEETPEGEGDAAETPNETNPAAATPPAKKKVGKVSMKELIRTCHIGQQAECVMSVLHKAYPKTPEAFASSGLPGSFDAGRVGTKHKIPVPPTWETELSLKGNSASVWESLIQANNLPFMAMLKNLRNCMEAGINAECHEKIIQRMEDERQVTNSKQLPIRFLSAFEAITFTDEQLEEMQKLAADAKESGETHRTIEQKVGTGKKVKTIQRKKPIAMNPPTTALLERYKEALDTAVRISVANNIPALMGKVVVLCDVSGSMDTLLSAGPARTHQEAFMPHAKSTGKPMLQGEEYCLEDYFASQSQESSHKVSMSMIWIGRDLDLSCAILDDKCEVIGKCSYSETTWGDCLKHGGDITDAPNGAEEVVSLDLDAVPENVYSVVFTVNSYSGEPFDDMKEAAVALRDDALENGEICAFRLAGTGPHKSIVVCSLFRKGSGWALRCMLTPQAGGATVSTLFGKIKAEMELQKMQAEKSVKRLVDVGLLMGLSVKYVSEDCQAYMFAAPKRGEEGPGYVEMKVEDDSILQNLKMCREQREALGRATRFPMQRLHDMMTNSEHVDYIVVVSDMIVQPAGDKHEVSTWLRGYRAKVNPELKFVTIDLLGKGTVAVDLDGDPNDIVIAGYSDQILRYIADASSGQLSHVESMKPPPPKSEKKRKGAAAPEGGAAAAGDVTVTDM